MKRQIQWLVIVIALAAGLASFLLRTSAAPLGATLSAPFKRKILTLPPEAPLDLRFFTTAVKTDSRGVGFAGKPAPVLPTQVPITVADRSGQLAGDGKGQILVSLDSPTAPGPGGKPLIDQLGTSNLAPLIVGGQINPALAANHVLVIKDTHGKTSHLSASDVEALILYLKSLQ